jgi:hypothetical protein
MEIRKKCWPQFFEEVFSGEKKYELRLADFECNPGDVLVLEEWDPQTKQYTGRSLRKKVTWVGKTKGFEVWPKQDVEKFGYQIMSLDDEVRELKGSNLDIDLTTPREKLAWERADCPWNLAEKTTEHKCAVKDVSICKHFKGIKAPDIVLCGFAMLTGPRMD